MVERTRKGFLDRTLANLRTAWQGIAGAEWDAAAAGMRPHLPEDDIPRLRRQMTACFESVGGEVSARSRAAALGRAYLALDSVGRERFLRVLADDFDVDSAAVDAAVAGLGEAEADARRASYDRLRAALTPLRVRLFTQFNALPDGFKFLVDLRAELMALARRDPVFRPMEQDLKGLLTAWFDIGMLELRRIGWDSAPGALLEKLIAYEAVHAIRSWDDLKNRLASDRRCYAYFHPKMPTEPLIFVEVALVDGLADNVQHLLDEMAPIQDSAKTDTAIFYSISNAQSGLGGISFGNFLIKRVVDDLRHELPNLKTFATLSPIPGFVRWLEGQDESLVAALRDEPDWDALKTPLMRSCARYLSVERGRNGRALDPVAHFHLTNGARMERLNWQADTSASGLAQSAGMMVNYLYKLDEIDSNNEAYTGGGKPAVSSSIRALARAKSRKVD